jgi:hypothetical protein
MSRFVTLRLSQVAVLRYGSADVTRHTACVRLIVGRGRSRWPGEEDEVER